MLERASGLKFNRDFFAGYSPERINPGDKLHRVATIKKVTSGSTPEVADFVDGLYARSSPPARTRRRASGWRKPPRSSRTPSATSTSPSINELAIIFDKMGIDTEAVLTAAGTKWNFLPFRPGLVGGHCIGVDPYYLTHKAQAIGYHPEIILAGRRLNDGMGAYVVSQLVKAMIRRRIQVEGAKVLVMGLTFKENCPDIRNTASSTSSANCADYNVGVDVYDPWVEAEDAEHEYGLSPNAEADAGRLRRDRVGCRA